MSVLSEKMRKAREKIVEAGRYKLTVLRPTDFDIMVFNRSHNVPDLLKAVVVGWEGVKEIDLYPSGDANPVDFDAEACAAWLVDNTDLLAPVLDDALERYSQHKAALGEAEKN